MREKDDKSEMREKLLEFAEGHKMFLVPLAALGFGLNLLFMLLELLLHANLFVLVFIIAAVVGVFCILLNVNQEENSIKWAFRFWAAMLVVTAAGGLATVLMVSMGHGIKNSTGSSMGYLFSWLAFVLACAGSLVFFLSDMGKKFMESVRGFNVYTDLKAAKTARAGDVVLCKVKETGQPEVWPYKDRFLHMLILGPTGSGKTSQVILPLINQDMQNLEAGVTVLEPKGDLAIKAAMMAKHYGRPYMYFDPSLANCPFFNPMSGKESDVVENMATTFRMLNPDSPQFFLDLNEQLMRNAVKVLKRMDAAIGVDGKHANLITLGQLLQNSGGQGRKIVQDFTKIPTPTADIAKENQDIASWFLNDYLSERSKVYENCSGVRSQVAKLNSNEFLRKVLNPDVDAGERNDLDFDKHLAEGGVICISTAQGTLRELSRFLGYFITLQLQSAVFRRPGNENTRRAHFLYIDEFQTYSNPGFSDMLTQGRSYRVASHLATQARAQIGMGAGRDGKNFVELVSTNARNIVLYPGCSYEDAKFYSDQFGEYMKAEVQKRYSHKKFNLNPFEGTEMTGTTEKLAANFTPTDLIYRPFGEIVYCLIKNNSIQPAHVGEISYIPQALNRELDDMVEEHMQKNVHTAVDPWEAMRNRTQAAAQPQPAQQMPVPPAGQPVPPMQAPGQVPTGYPPQPQYQPQPQYPPQPTGYPQPPVPPQAQPVPQMPSQGPQSAPQRPPAPQGYQGCPQPPVGAQRAPAPPVGASVVPPPVQQPVRSTVVPPPSQKVVPPPVQQPQPPTEIPDIGAPVVVPEKRPSLATDGDVAQGLLRTNQVDIGLDLAEDDLC